MFHTWRTRLSQVVNAIKMVAFVFVAILVFAFLLLL
jgi:cell division protein FtsX